MLLANPFLHDARVARHAHALVSLGHEVSVYCLAAEGAPEVETKAGVRIVRIRPPGWIAWTGPLRAVPLLRYFSRYGFLARAAREWRPDVVHGNDLETLLPSARLAELLGVPLVYDDHELCLEKLGQGTETLLSGWKKSVDDAIVRHLRRRGAALERRFLPRTAAAFAGSPLYAKVLTERYGREVVPLRNVPWRSDLPANPRLRSAAGLPPDAKVVLYQGGVTPGGGAQQCIAAAREFPPGWFLVFLGVTWMRGRLEAVVREEGAADRVRFLPAVPPAELPGWTRAADLGLAPLRPVNLGQTYSLANKLFEYLHAGLLVVSSDIPAQAALVRELDAGPVIEEVTAERIAEAVRSVAVIPEAERKNRGERLRAVARERHCWEVESKVLASGYEAVFQDVAGKRA